jgi:hypothetical protein
MHTPPRSRRRPTAALVVLATAVTTATVLAGVVPAPAGARAAAPAAPRVTDWVIDADTLHVRNADEDSCYIPTPFGCAAESDGDEPIVAVIAFRTRVGMAGTTRAWRLAEASELCTGARQGRTCQIADSAGRAVFHDVNITDINSHPELIGTLQVVFENDATPLREMNSRLAELVTIVQEELDAAARDATSLSADAFANIGQRVQDRTEVSWWRDLATWLASRTDPTDRVDYRINAYLAIDATPEYRDILNAELADAVRPPAPDPNPNCGRPALGRRWWDPCRLQPVQPEQRTFAAVLGPSDLVNRHDANGVHYEMRGRVAELPRLLPCRTNPAACLRVPGRPVLPTIPPPS